MWASQRGKGSLGGFTIVELLIVIVAIGILAVISTAAYSAAQNQSRAAKVNADLRSLERTIYAAREKTSKPLKDITNNGCTRCSCPYLSGDMTAYNSLPKTHACWTSYYGFLSAVGTAADTNLSDLRDGDPWGSPYIIDENENEQPANVCRLDDIRSAGSSANVNGYTSVGARTIRFFLPQC